MGGNYGMKVTVLKGYSDGREVWAISKQYGSGETGENLVFEVEETPEIKELYESQKNVFDNTRKKKWFNRRNSTE